MTSDARARRRPALTTEDKSQRRDEIVAAAKKVLAPQRLSRDAYALGARFENHLANIYERFIDDITAYMTAAQQRGKVINAPPGMVAYTVGALIGQLARRRLITDDGVTAAEVADFVIEFIGNGLRPRQSRSRDD